MPKAISPELATLVNEPPRGENWCHEIKLDGYRILTFKHDHSIILKSRNNRDWSAYFDNVIARINKLPVKRVIFDGEVVVLDDKHRSNFQLLQNAIGASGRHPFVYYIFDLLYFDQYNICHLPLLERKNILKQILPDNDHVLRYCDHIIGPGKEILLKACEFGLEGIVSKRLDCPYQEKRTKNWLKTKCINRQEFVIGGFSPPKRSRTHFGSLYLGYYDNNGTLKFCGNVGTGFTAKSLKEIYDALQPYITSENPFDVRPPGVTSATWVKPKLVAEIEFSDWTNEGILRHPSFKGLRADKPATAIIRETETGVHQIDKSSSMKPKLKRKQVNLPIHLTNPNKLWYPEDKITKLTVAQYYDEIQAWILPYVANRPLTLVRCPTNYNECFFQKHLTKGMPKSIYGVPIREDKKVEQTVYIKDREGLLGLVQMSVFEIHGWGSRIENFEYPDMITFDLDPSPDVKWLDIVKGAKLIRRHLREYGLESFIKTTGGKGLHIVVPILPEYDWVYVKKFAHAFVKILVAHYPDQYIGEMSKRKRVGKIFVDYLRNQRNATTVCAYSTRARVGAPVSVPIDWDELGNDIRGTYFTVQNVPGRLRNLKKDPWERFFKVKQSLKK